jgi:hypothetical protein
VLDPAASAYPARTRLSVTVRGACDSLLSSEREVVQVDGTPQLRGGATEQIGRHRRSSVSRTSASIHARMAAESSSARSASQASNGNPTTITTSISSSKGHLRSAAQSPD